jgi:hypothetical protein
MRTNCFFQIAGAKGAEPAFGQLAFDLLPAVGCIDR